MYSAGFFATTLSYDEERNSFWHSDLSAYANSETWYMNERKPILVGVMRKPAKMINTAMTGPGKVCAASMFGARSATMRKKDAIATFASTRLK